MRDEGENPAAFFYIHLRGIEFAQQKLCTYLIFVISFTQAGILNSNILHPKTMKIPQNYNKQPQKE